MVNYNGRINTIKRGIIMTPLEHLDFIRHYEIDDEHRTINYTYACRQSLDIIENALKDYEKLKQENETLIGFGGHFFDESFKQNKVLEIIKDRFSIQFQKNEFWSRESLGYYGIMQIGINPIYIKTKEEYDLLKEVLL